MHFHSARDHGHSLTKDPGCSEDVMYRQGCISTCKYHVYTGKMTGQENVAIVFPQIFISKIKFVFMTN